MTSNGIRRLLLALVVVLAPAPVRAQAPALTAFQDSVAALGDAAPLLALRDRLAAAQDGGVEHRIRRGLVELRLYELTEGEAYLERAGDLLDEAADRAPDLAWAHLGHALRLIRGPELRIPSPFGVLDRVVAGQVFAEVAGLDPRSRAWRALERAVELDSTLVPAALEMAGLALGRPDRREELETARRVLQRATRTAEPDGGALLLLADVEAALGDLGASERSARAARAAGADSASTDHAVAVALLRQAGKAEEGMRTYRAGIERLSVAAAQRYYADILPILKEAERGRWASGSLEERRAMLAELWELRAALAGVTPAERLAEHYRRLTVATAQYLRKSRRSLRPPGSLQVDEHDLDARFDDRGLVLIRRGEPDDVVSTVASEASVAAGATHSPVGRTAELLRDETAAMPPNESWIYRRAGSTPELYHFVKPPLSSDYVLMDGVSCDRRWLQDRILLDARLQQLSMDCNGLRKAEIDAATRKATLAALSRDVHEPDFDAEVPFFYDIYTFRGTGGKTDVTAAIAVPGDRIRPVNEGSPAVYALDLSFILVDTLARRVTRVDTVYRARAPRPLGKGEYLRAHIDLQAPPSATTVHRIVLHDSRLEGSGQSYGGATAVRDYSGSALSLSDIVLAELDGASWRRGDVALGLVAPQQFPAGEFTVFYEVYNLPADAAYRTEIVLDRVDRGTFAKLRGFFGLGGGPIARLRFDGVAPEAGAGVQEARRVAADLDAGAYEVEVRVTHLATGETATRTRSFLVPEP